MPGPVRRSVRLSNKYSLQQPYKVGIIWGRIRHRRGTAARGGEGICPTSASQWEAELELALIPEPELLRVPGWGAPGLLGSCTGHLYLPTHPARAQHTQGAANVGDKEEKREINSPGSPQTS